MPAFAAAHRETSDEPTGIVGRSPAARALRELVRRVAPLRLPVLIEGPTGSGKELVARALHTLSGREGRFVAVNVCAISDAMFEATLFGHVRGAFTGAVGDAAGYLAEADGGTLFLDEIGGLSLPMQGKLLRALETREFRPVGGRRDRTSDFRVVTATNEPLDTLVAGGRFRADLAHRIRAIRVDVPALAARREDIPLLAAHFTRAAAPVSAVTLTAAAMERLQAFDWPGNVRELRNVVEGAVALAELPWIDEAEVARHLSSAWTAATAPRSAARDELASVLRDCGWDTAAAARRLGIHRATVYRRMTRLGVEVPRQGEPPAAGIPDPRGGPRALERA